MTQTILLRIAATVALVQGTAHGLLVVFDSPKNGPAEIAVVEAMRSQQFNFRGSMRSYWDFHFGYGLFSAFTCLIEAVLFWQLAKFANTNPSLSKQIVALFFFANLGYAILVWRYFFITPLVFDLAITICLGLALMRTAA
ncbi:MAG: hypothetical protein HY268_05910 [Deltaproteobacteria bacterium]|nr:hypothetical protein [Deltaproteobacteria bacterium]